MERLEAAQKLVRLLASGITLLVGTAGLRAQDAYGSTVARDTVSGNLKAERPKTQDFRGFSRYVAEILPVDILGLTKHPDHSAANAAVFSRLDQSECAGA